MGLLKTICLLWITCFVNVLTVEGNETNHACKQKGDKKEYYDFFVYGYYPCQGKANPCSGIDNEATLKSCQQCCISNQPMTPVPSFNKAGKSLPWGAIIGSITSVLVLGGIVGVTVFLVRQRRQNANRSDQGPSNLSIQETNEDDERGYHSTYQRLP